ncbi:hypothetical protein Tco_1540316 [Tanacetum coccineum]
MVINKAVNEGYFKAVEVGRESVVVSYLQYADDTIFFRARSRHNGINLTRILKYFEEASGLKINRNKRGLNVGSLKASNWGLLGKWCWRFRVESTAWWVRVIKSVYGEDGGVDREGHVSVKGRGAWGNIINVGSEMGKLGLNFTNSFRRRVGNGEDTRFWLDREKVSKEMVLGCGIRIERGILEENL